MKKDKTSGDFCLMKERETLLRKLENDYKIGAKQSLRSIFELIEGQDKAFVLRSNKAYNKVINLAKRNGFGGVPFEDLKKYKDKIDKLCGDKLI